MALKTRLTGTAVAAIASLLGVLSLAACGGGSEGTSVGASVGTSVGNSAGASASPSASPSATAYDRATTQSASAKLVAAPPLRLFVPDTAHASIDASDTLEPEAGGPVATTTLETPAAIGNNVQVDTARDELYVISGHAVSVYAAADALASTSIPSRSIALPASLGTPRTLYLDQANDLLYVGGDTTAGKGDGEIVVYSNAHAAAGTSVKPARLMFLEGGVSFFTIDPLRRRLYVVDAVAGVHVFANVDTASGRLVDTTTIPVLGTGLALDSARDRLYVADLFAGLILVDQASSLTPVVTATLSIDDAHYVAVDAAADRAYVSAQGNLYVFDNASELTAATTLNAPAVSSAAGASLGAAGVR